MTKHTQSSIRLQLRENLRAASISDRDVRVQPDPYRGWQIAVVAAEFSALSSPERRRIALTELDDLEIGWCDLLTPEEREWAGSLPIDGDLDQLPLWPEALARGAQPGSSLFPSDLDEDLQPPIVTTFYSLRGGVGRSTALAYTGQILAEAGRKVLCVDMDLEAPGLAALFGKEDEVVQDQGVAHLLHRIDQGEEPDISSHLLRVDRTNDLYLLPAGRPDAAYARTLQFLDPGAWYREEPNPLRVFMAVLREGLPFVPDVVLLDARTGISPLSSPLLFDLADLAVIVFFPHPQAQTGTGALVRGLLSATTYRTHDDQSLAPDLRFLVSPVPASKAREVVDRYKHRALAWIADWIALANPGREEREPLIEADITHFVRYREDLATSDSIASDVELWAEFKQVAEWIEQLLPTAEELKHVAPLGQAKEQILGELRFSAGTAEEQDDLSEVFVTTLNVDRALDPGIPLVIGRKGTGKTAVFRRLSENPELAALVVQAPAPLRGDRPWMMSAEGFVEVEKILARTDADWRRFWTFYCCVALSNQCRHLAPGMPEQLSEIGADKLSSESATLAMFDASVLVPRGGLLLNDWLDQLDHQVAPNTLLLFDGLDTGFGSTDTDRIRRREALEGLFSLLTERGSSQNLRFKILLREDIWRKLDFENKSHFFGRSVFLKWDHQGDYFKIALKQAVRSLAFREQLSQLPGKRMSDSNPDSWSQEEVWAGWNLLVGERMKGGKTAYTRNWVWNRLADGNSDHAPRYLLQLFHQANEWEHSEHRRSEYSRSVIRPRALIRCLPAVSAQAFGGLREEFKGELSGLFERLVDIGRTPLGADQLNGLDEDVALAREVGLLAIYEGTQESIKRYKVPDIFRHALEMTRKGQQ